MKGISIDERATELAHYIIDSKDTVRGTAKKFGISKSTVHMDVTIRNGIRTGIRNEIKSPRLSRGIITYYSFECDKF